MMTSMKRIITIGLDVAKIFFQHHGDYGGEGLVAVVVPVLRTWTRCRARIFDSNGY